MTEQKDIQAQSLSNQHQPTKPQSQHLKPRPYKLRLRNWLNTIFILLAAATIAIYFFSTEQEGRIAMFITGSVAVMVKTAEVMIRLTHKPAARKRRHIQQ